MFDRHVHYGYRNLTKSEQASAERAIDWLIGKRVQSRQIALMTDSQLDREAKILNVTVEKGRLVFFRKLHYENTDFDLYLTETLPCLKVERWLFPNLCWTGRKPSFGFHIREEDVENYRQNHAKMGLIMLKRYDKIETSTTKSNIQKQIMVGRRIALRA